MQDLSLGGSLVRRTAAAAVAALVVATISAASASAAPPANDNFANAQTLTGSTASAAGTTVEATRENASGEPDSCTGADCPGFEGGHTVWYSWTAPFSGTVTLDTCTAAIDSVLAVYTGSALNALTRVVNNNNHADCSPSFGSKLQFSATSGTTYKIGVDDCCGAQQNTFTLNLVLRPANDDFANAQQLIGPDPSANGTTDNGTTETGEPDHCVTDPNGQCGAWVGDHSVWFRWTAVNSGTTTIDTCTASIDSILAVYTGSAVNSLTRVVDGNNGCQSGFGSIVTFEAAAGTEYKIAVGDAGGAREDSFTLDIDGAAPANNAFADAETLTGTRVEANGTTAGADKEAGEPDHCEAAGDCDGWVGDHSVWYAWTAPFFGPAQIDTCLADIDSILAVYTGSAVDALTRVADSNNGCPAGFGSVLTFDAVAGTQYWFAVGDAGGAREDTFTLEVESVLGPPETDIDSGPRKRTTKRRATFRFSMTFPTAPPRGVGGDPGFECSLDGKPFVPCTSPRSFRVKVGRHTFKVKAHDEFGNEDPSAAKYRWRVKKKRKRR